MPTVTVKPSGGNYTSLSAAEAGQQGSLSEPLIIECYAMEDTIPVVWAGWTMNGHYIHVTVPVAERHDGKWNDTKYRLVVANNRCISLDNGSQLDIRFTGVQFRVTAVNGFDQCGIVIPGVTWNHLFRAEKCIFRGTTVVSETEYHSGINTWDTGASSVGYLINCIFQDFKHSLGGNSCGGVIPYNSGTIYAYNCTAHNCDVGYGYLNGGTLIVKNSIADDCNDGFGSVTAGSDYNVSNIASDAPGANSRTGSTLFVDEANDDFHLSASDTVAKGYGVTDPGSGLFSDDIDGDTRSAPWDIGADETSSAVTGTIVSTLDAVTSAFTGTASAPENPFSLALRSPSTAFNLVLSEDSGTVSGTIAATIAAIISTSSGTVDVSGSIAQTLDAVVSIANGTVGVSGSIAKTIDAIVSTANGSIGVQGTAASTLDAVISAASGTLTFQGSIVAELDAVVSTASGNVGVSGSSATTLDPVVADMAGNVSTAGTVEGTINITLAAITSTASGSIGVSGVIAPTLDPVVSNASGLLTIQGSVASTLDAVEGILSGNIGVQGGINGILTPVISLISGLTGPAGAISSQLDPIVPVLTGIFTNEFTGTINSVLEPIVSDFSVVHIPPPVVGTMAATLGPLKWQSDGWTFIIKEYVMAFYSDPQFQVSIMTPVAFAANFGTSTASSTIGANAADVVKLPKFFQRSVIAGIRLKCTTIPNAAHTNLRAVFLNGTSTFGSVTLTASTVGQWLEGVITEGVNVFADDGIPTVNVLGTATASGQALGSYDVWFLMQNLFD